MEEFSPPQREFLQYYRDLCAQVGDVPSRAQVDLAKLKPYLGWVTLAERQGPRHLVPTVMGSAVDEVLQTSLTGVNLFEYLPDEIAETTDCFYSHIVGQPCGGFMVRTLVGHNEIMRGYRSLQLPLRGATGEINRMIGVIAVSAVPPVASKFGSPSEVNTVEISEIRYLNIGFGLPDSGS